MEKEVIPYHRPMKLSRDDYAEIHERIQEVLATGQLTNGKYVRTLEDNVKDFYDVEYCIATSSCTIGLMICLEMGNYHNVQTTAFNWFSDRDTLNFLKQKINYNDIDMNTWLPIEQFENRSLYLNTFGNMGFSEKMDVIYDSSHCLGNKLRDIGLANVFSLAPTKLITSCEGGLIITTNKGLYNYASKMRDRCSRMSEIHAIIGLQTLKYIDVVKSWKRKVYGYYKRHIRGQFQSIPIESNYNTIGFLNVNNLVIPKHITTKQYYEPLKKGLKNTDYVYDKIVCLPSWHGVDYKQIVEDINEANEI